MCDHEAFAEEGREHHAAGQNASAYDAFERAYQCKPDPLYAEKALISACNMPNVQKARAQWKRLSAEFRQRTLMICKRNGISEDELNAPACDHEAHAEKARAHYAAGQHAAAYDAFENARSCEQGPLYAEKAFVAACNMPSLARARVQWKRLPAALKQRSRMICIRNGIQEDALNAP